MCMGGSSGGGSGQQYYLNERDGQLEQIEVGVPVEYANRGIRTVTEFQAAASRELSDKQLAAQREIADKSDAFNREQFQYQKDLNARQQQDALDQATRQSEYDTGRAANLDEGARAIDAAFSRFSPEYFQDYAKSYMGKVGDEVAYQERDANRQTLYSAARRGVSGGSSQADMLGQIAEKSGRTLADQAGVAEDQASALQGSVSGAKNNLLQQVQASQSIGGPIAGGDAGSVGTQLQTQKNAISGITNQAGDVVASYNAVPTVSPLGQIFGNVLSNVGAYFAGTQAYNNNQTANALRGTSPRA